MFWFLLFLFFEFHQSRFDRIRHSVLSRTVEIDPGNPPDTDGFVRFNLTRGPPPMPVFDDQVNYSLLGTWVRWQVEYCQWRENFQESQFFINIPDYSVGWSKELVSSIDFVDRNYQNPLVRTYPNWDRVQNMTIGNLTISETIFSSLGERKYYYEPSKTDLAAFAKSPLSENGFEYLGHGYFYRPYGSNLETRIEELKRKKKLNSDTKDVARVVINGCVAGDIRGRHLLYTPQNVSILGYKNGSVVQRIVYEGYDIGTAAEGFVDGYDMLSSLQPDMKDIRVVQMFFVGLSLLAVCTGARDDRMRVLNLVALGVFVLFVRSLFWTSVLLNSEFWGAAFLGVFVMYWKLTHG
jgi:hypothetical protein